jgi:hypothetical protein
MLLMFAIAALLSGSCKKNTDEPPANDEPAGATQGGDTSNQLKSVDPSQDQRPDSIKKQDSLKPGGTL